MKVLLLMSLCCALALSSAQDSDVISLNEDESALRQRYRKPLEYFMEKLLQQQQSSRYDFRNREPDEIDIQPCPRTMRCVNGICSSIHFRWGTHHEHIDFECGCHDGWTGPTCEIPTVNQIQEE